MNKKYYWALVDKKGRISLNTTNDYPEVWVVKKDAMDVNDKDFNGKYDIKQVEIKLKGEE